MPIPRRPALGFHHCILSGESPQSPIAIIVVRFLKNKTEVFLLKKPVDKFISKIFPPV
jgi:hypothetical protein